MEPSGEKLKDERAEPPGLFWTRKDSCCPESFESVVISMATAEPAPSWWKLTFMRKKKSEAKVLYEIPAEHVSNSGETPGTSDETTDSQFNARLERIVDKSATKGRHVKVSHSGRFKEKKRIRATLAENPDLFPETEISESNKTGK